MTNPCAGTGQRWNPLTGEWYGQCPGCRACRETESDAEAEARELAESERGGAGGGRLGRAAGGES